MAFDKDLFEALIPEFSETKPNVLAAVAAQAECFVDPDCFGDKAAMACVYMTAHLLKVGQRKGNSGQLTMDKVGQVSQQFAQNISDDSLDSSGYGAEYKRIRKSCVISPFISC